MFTNSDQGLLGHDRILASPDARRLHATVRPQECDLVRIQAGLWTSGLYWDAVNNSRLSLTVKEGQS